MGHPYYAAKFGNFPGRDTERAFARIATVSFRYGSAMSFDVKIEQQPRLPRYQRHPSFDHDMARISRIYSKHSVESLRRAPHVLDWANMPDPFRHYEGVPVFDLPADPPSPETPARRRRLLLRWTSGWRRNWRASSY